MLRIVGVYNKRNWFLLWIILLMINVSCSKYQKLLKSSDNEKKYEAAVKFFEEEDYYRTLQLLDELIPYFRGTARAEDLHYYYAYCYYEQGDYITASYHFKNFVSTFHNSKREEECAYLSVYCIYLDSPPYSLDQTASNRAIRELQLFIDRYPNSDKVEECNLLLDKMRMKLEKKSFELAKMYYRMEEFRAAIWSFKGVLKDYPETKYKDEALFLILKANYLYASNSISNKRKERFEDAVEAYNAFKSVSSDSKYLKDAESIYKNLAKALN